MAHSDHTDAQHTRDSWHVLHDPRIHGRGECDLPDFGDRACQSGLCQWVPNDGVQICGCRMCSGYYERKAENRRARHSKRADIQEYLDDT